MSAFLGVPVDAAYHVVSAMAGLLTPLLGGLAAAAAIVLFTMAVRLLIVPLSYRALRGMAAQARIAPRAQALRRKHAGQPDRLQRELSALYKSEGTSMFAGCLPLLLQWPFLSVMYLLFRSAKVGSARNALLGHNLFGAPLGGHWLGGAGPLSAQGAVFGGLFLLLAGVAWLSTRMARRSTPAGGGVTAASPVPVQAARQSGRASGRPEAPAAERAAAATGALARLAPYVTVVVAAFVPLAAGLYLVTTAAWSLAERMLLARAGHHP